MGLGETDVKAPRVLAAVADIAGAAVAAGRRVGTFTPDPAEAPSLRAQGISLFLLGSDHGFITSGARQLRAAAEL